MRTTVMLISLACLLLIGACQKNDDAGIANPASVYCKEQGGTLELVTADDGSVSGLCTLKNGTKCDEWAYFRNECPKACGECPQLTPPSPDFCKDGKEIAPKQDSCGCWGPPGCEPVACTADAKLCPDGTGVGRVPPDCEFAPCPDQ
jgi:putative hemolysin